MFVSLIPKIVDHPEDDHVYLYRYFPGYDERPFHYRDLGARYLVLSRVPPSCKYKNVTVDVDSVIPFDLIACPFRLQRDRSQNTRRMTVLPDDQLKEWLDRKMLGADVTFSSYTRLSHLRLRRKGFFLPRVQFKGSLQITDKAAFREAMISGIGSKGWAGFGTMITPAVKKAAVLLANEQ